MIVAASTTDGQSEPNRRSRFNSIGHVFDSPFFGNNSAFVIHSVVSIETGRKPLLVCRVFEKVSGQLLDRELIERHVRVVSADHPVAPRPLASLDVVLISARIGVACGVEPYQSHPLAVVRRLEQTINHYLVGVLTLVANECVYFCNRWRQSG